FDVSESCRPLLPSTSPPEASKYILLLSVDCDPMELLPLNPSSIKPVCEPVGAPDFSGELASGLKKALKFSEEFAPPKSLNSKGMGAPGGVAVDWPGMYRKSTLANCPVRRGRVKIRTPDFGSSV